MTEKKTHTVTLIPGDGIGPEVTDQAVRVLQAVAGGFGHEVELQTKLIGGAALKAVKEQLRAVPRNGVGASAEDVR